MLKNQIIAKYIKRFIKGIENKEKKKYFHRKCFFQIQATKRNKLNEKKKKK